MNLSSSFKIKLNVSKAHMVANEIKEEDESDEPSVTLPKERKTSMRYTRKRCCIKVSKKNDNEEGDDLNSSTSSDVINKPRVDRFLSIIEIPPEVVWLTQQKFDQKYNGNFWNDNSIVEEPTNEIIKEDVKNKKETPKKKKTFKYNNKNKETHNLHSYRDGTGITQAAKAMIIKDIIRNYDIDSFMNELRAKDVVQIQLNKNDANARPVRNRIMKLMKSDVIRINDGDYMRELSKRIQMTYKEKQDKLMQNLEDRERKRERKLKLKGLITKTSEEEEQEEKTKKKTKCLVRKNSNLLEPINSSSTAKFNSMSSLNLTRLPKLNK